MDEMNEFVNIIKQLRDEGIIKWVVILRPFSDVVFILHLANNIEMQISKQDFHNKCMIKIYDEIKFLGV